MILGETKSADSAVTATRFGTRRLASLSDAIEHVSATKRNDVSTLLQGGSSRVVLEGRHLVPSCPPCTYRRRRRSIVHMIVRRVITPVISTRDGDDEMSLTGAPADRSRGACGHCGDVKFHELR